MVENTWGIEIHRKQNKPIQTVFIIVLLRYELLNGVYGYRSYENM
jgi:hypothetical protein